MKFLITALPLLLGCSLLQAAPGRDPDAGNDQPQNLQQYLALPRNDIIELANILRTIIKEQGISLSGNGTGLSSEAIQEIQAQVKKQYLAKKQTERKKQ